jgi:hypothetical protein
MRTIHTLVVTAALAGSALLSVSANAVEVCDKTCVGPLCAKDCTRAPDVTVGHGERDRAVVIEEERRHREPRPGVEIDIRK